MRDLSRIVRTNTRSLQSGSVSDALGVRRTERLEDADLLRGRARFVDDLPAPSAYAVFVRSPYAHARIDRIERAAAVAAPGVLAVFDADDLGLGGLRGHAMLPPAFDRPPLARTTVRFVGEPVAVVVAATRAQAADAAELVDVAYDPLPVVLDVAAAIADPRPVFDGQPDNIAFALPLPRGREVLADAAHVVANRSRQPARRRRADGARRGARRARRRPPAGVGVDAARAQGARRDRRRASAIDPALVRVRAPNVGGGFGGKFEPSPEAIVVAAVARRLRRSVRWTQTRIENLLNMPHGRAQTQHAELGPRRRRRASSGCGSTSSATPARTRWSAR